MAIKPKIRRQQVRQQRTDRSNSLWQRLRARAGPFTMLCAAVFLVAATVIALSGKPSLNYAVGQKIEQSILAAVDFKVDDQSETLKRKRAARAAAASHYRVDFDLIAGIASELLNLYQAAQASETLEAFAQSSTTNQWETDQPTYELLREYGANAQGNPFELRVDELRSRLRWEYTWDPNSTKERTPEPNGKFIVVHAEDPKNETQSSRTSKKVSVFDLTPITNLTTLTRGADDLVARSGFAPALRNTVSSILVRRMSESPMLLLDKARTNREMTEQEEQVELVILAFQRGQPFIPARPDHGLTNTDLQLLGEHDRAYRLFLASDTEDAIRLRTQKILENAGLACIFALMTIGLIAYLGMYQRRILDVRTRLVALMLLLLGALGSARLIDAHWPAPINELIYAPTLLTASILAIAYSRRFAIGVTTILAIMMVLTVQGDAAMLVTMVVGLSAAVYMLNEIRTRTRLIKVGAVAAIALFLASAAFSLKNNQELSFATIHASWAAIGALLAIVVLQATLPLIERVFNITTSLTLLEWRDPTRPLLQRLAQEAPGTYRHSLVVGDLAEAACRAIGADSLLAQVGALYHDIGKLHKAEYFAENQESSINRHENLEPSMSLLIIVGHVKDGVEMAREYKLPRPLHSFIEEHHGTMVVRYFHHIASEKQPHIASGKHDREVPDAVFRYRGPKPRSRESAILMLCDGTEGAVRALSDATPGRIEGVVHSIVMDRLNDAQFDDCEITMRELHRVEESLVKSLCSLYHARVAYPKATGKTDATSEEQQEARRKPAAG